MTVTGTELIDFVEARTKRDRDTISRNLSVQGRRALVGYKVYRGRLVNVYDIDELLETFWVKTQSRNERSRNLGLFYVELLEEYKHAIR